MRQMISISLLLSHLYAQTELIYISDNTEEIEAIYETYRQDLIIQDKAIYLIPENCLIERYFGGYSQGDLLLPEAPTHTQTIQVTQTVFEAQQQQEIEAKIQADKERSRISGSTAPEFLDDRDGRGFGGASEADLDLSTALTHPSESIQTDDKPSCELLEDGTGYELFGLINAKHYTPLGLRDIQEPVIHFH